jgi:hypothetical protein
MFKKKQAKKSIFTPEIVLRVERSDPARNSYFPSDFLSARFECIASPQLWKVFTVNPHQNDQG